MMTAELRKVLGTPRSPFLHEAWPAEVVWRQSEEGRWVRLGHRLSLSVEELGMENGRS